MVYSAAPILETKRLRLRAYKLSDFEEFLRLYTSPHSRYMDGPVSRAEAWNKFASGAGRWALVGYGPWIITRRNDGRSLGLVSLNHPICESEERELGWALWEGFTGQGYAIEAAKRVHAFAVQALGWTDFVSYIDAANTASIKLAERLGAKHDLEATDKQTDDTLVYRHHILA